MKDWKNMTFLMLGFISALCFVPASAWSWQGPYEVLPVEYRSFTPSDVIQLDPSYEHEIRYQIRLYEALDALTKELEQELLDREDMEQGLEEAAPAESPGAQTIQESGGGEIGAPRIQLEFEIIP